MSEKSIPAGIGLFITYIGFQNVGIIQTNQYTLTQFVDIHGAINGDGIMTVLPALLALVGFLIIVILQKLNIKGNVIIGIVATTVIYYVVSGTVPSFDMAQIGQSFRDFADIGITGSIPGSFLGACVQPCLRRRRFQRYNVHNNFLPCRYV